MPPSRTSVGIRRGARTRIALRRHDSGSVGPVVARLLPFAVPQVVILLAGGVVIGPEALNWAQQSYLDLLSNVGLGFLFLMAGYELPPLLLRQRPGRLALRGWLISVFFSIVIVGILESTGLVHDFVPVALALTTTALGTLLPILRDNGMLGGALGPNIFAAGAVGELGPVLAISVFLGANGSWQSIVAIATVVLTAYVAARIPRWFAGSRIGSIVSTTSEDTTQSVLQVDHHAAAGGATAHGRLWTRHRPGRLPCRHGAATIE